MHNTQLRSLIAGVRQQIDAITAASTTDEGRSSATLLAERFAALEKHLNVGPEPALRACPKCGRMGMLQATVCSGCWTRLAPAA